jgi:hypothetical protein
MPPAPTNSTIELVHALISKRTNVCLERPTWLAGGGGSSSVAFSAGADHVPPAGGYEAGYTENPL